MLRALWPQRVLTNKVQQSFNKNIQQQDIKVLAFSLPLGAERGKVIAMIVCIAEKPSVAQDIARILGATIRKDGYMEEKRLPSDVDFRTSLRIEVPRGLHPHVEALEPRATAHDTTAFRYPPKT